MKSIPNKVRFIAVSATVPNLNDIAKWLNSAQVCSFGEEYRPVKLKKIVLSFPKSSTNSFVFDHALNYKYKFYSLLFSFRII